MAQICSRALLKDFEMIFQFESSEKKKIVQRTSMLLIRVDNIATTRTDSLHNTKNEGQEYSHNILLLNNKTSTVADKIRCYGYELHFIEAFQIEV